MQHNNDTKKRSQAPQHVDWKPAAAAIERLSLHFPRNIIKSPTSQQQQQQQQKRKETSETRTWLK